MPLPGHYRVNFTDPSSKSALGEEGSFVVEPYTTNGTVNPHTNTLDDDANKASTSIVIEGKGMPNYGEHVAESFVRMLENFSSAIPPIKPITGQLWYDTGRSYLIVQENLSVNQFKVSGNITALVSYVISQPLTIGPDINPQAFFQLVNINDNSYTLVRPVSSSYAIGPNLTTITLDIGYLTGISSLTTSPYYIVLPSNRKGVLKIYNDATKLLGDNASWTVVPSVIISATEPDDASEGEIWIDTSLTPNVLKIADSNGDFTNGYLSTDGGVISGNLDVGGTLSFTGDLLLNNPPTLPLHAASKQYVDDEIVAAVGPLSTDITTLQSDVLTKVSKAGDTMTGYLVLHAAPVSNMQAANKQYVDTEISTVTASVSNKVSKAGDTMTGTLNFDVPAAGSSPSIYFTGQGSVTGFDVDLNVTGDTNKEILLLTLKTPGPSSDYTAFQINKDNGSSTRIFEIRPYASFAPFGMYEQDPTALALGSAATASLKYVTIAELDSTLTTNGLDAVYINSTFDPNTMEIEYTLSDSSTDILDISHTHANEFYVFQPAFNEFTESVYARYSHINTNVISFNDALHIVDRDKTNIKDGLLIDNASLYKEVIPFAIDTSNQNDIIILATEFYDLELRKGDTVRCFSEGIPGFTEIGFSASITGSDPTGLTNDATLYTATIAVDGYYEFTISIAGQDAQTFTDLISELNNSLVSNDSPPISQAIASIDGSNIVITSTTYPADSLTTVSVVDGTLFTSLTNFVIVNNNVDGVPRLLQNDIATISDIVIENSILPSPPQLVARISLDINAGSPVLDESFMAVLQVPKYISTNTSNAASQAQINKSNHYKIIDVTSPYTVTQDDLNAIIRFNSGSGCTVNLPDELTEFLYAGFNFKTTNKDIGAITLVVPGSSTSRGTLITSNPNKLNEVVLEEDLLTSLTSPPQYAWMTNDW